MKSTLLGASALALSTCLGASMALSHGDENSISHYRVFVGDHDKATVIAFDLSHSENHWVFPMSGQAKLYGVDDGATIVAIQSDKDAVNFINTGIALHSHGDHSDLEISDPALVSEQLTGPKPLHIIDQKGKITINFDNGRYDEVVDAAALSRGLLKASRIEQTTSDGDRTCSGVQNKALSGAYVAAGCTEGVLVITSGENGQIAHMLAYSDELPKGRATQTLLGAADVQVFLGDFGADGLVVVDPTAAPHFHYIALPARHVDFTLDPSDARFGYVLTEDGTLHQIDILNGALGKAAKVVGLYSMDGHENDPHPRIAMAGDAIVITDPKEGLVRNISKETLTQTDAVKIDGVPYNIAVVGGSGQAHEHGHSHGDPKVYAGYFDDSQVHDRALSDYAGDWQSIYPYLLDGTLDPIWTHKAENGPHTAEEYRAEYDTGYKTDVERITINGDVVTFYKEKTPTKAHYIYDGKEILTYKKGNRGVRFIYKKVNGDASAPQFIQFSDHGISPAKAYHFHIYWGNDRAALLNEVTNWPTYYPSEMKPGAIVNELKAH